MTFCATVLGGVILCAAYFATRPRPVAATSASPRVEAQTERRVPNPAAVKGTETITPLNSEADNPPTVVPVASSAPIMLLRAGEAVVVDASSAPGIDPAPAPPPAPAPAMPARMAASPFPTADPAKLNPNDTYLQMAAVDRGMAEVLVEVLHRKGIPAITIPGPTEEILRVLVGPVNDPDSIARLKAELAAAGFPSFARKVRS